MIKNLNNYQYKVGVVKMNRRKNNLVKLYMKLAVKTPIFIMAIIFIGLISMYYLTVTTSTNIYKTYDASVLTDDKGKLYIEILYDGLDENIKKKTSIYWYTDKADKIYETQNYELVEEANRRALKIILQKDEETMLLKTGNKNISVDIAVDRVTILDRIINR